MGILLIIVCAVLIFIVLIQNSKGGGLASNFSGSNQILGVAKTKDTLEMVTWIAAGLLLLLCFFSTPKARVVSAPVAGTEKNAKGKGEQKLGKDEQSETKRFAKAFQSGGNRFSPKKEEPKKQP